MPVARSPDASRPRGRYVELLCIPALMLFHRLGYDLVGTLASSGSRDHAPLLETAWDRDLPYVAAFILPYLLAWVYPLAIALYVCVTGRHHRQLFRSIYVTFFVLTLVECVAWLLFPARISIRVTPEVLSESGWLGDLTGYAYDHATPWNVMPSGHIAFAFLTWRLSRHFAHAAHRWFFFGMFVLITASALFIKNHFLLDVVGGLLIGHLAYAYVFRPAFRYRVLSGFSTVGLLAFFGLATAAMAAVHAWITG